MKVILSVLVVVIAVVLAGLVFRGRTSSVQERIGVPESTRVEKTDEQWRSVLTAEQFRVTRQKGTERAFSGAYWNSKEAGIFRCVGCDQPLFDSNTKFDSGTGWPSFWRPIDENHVSLIEDNSLFAKRIEVTCSRCDSHLGHVFDDGPQPTGLRYCMNSAALKLETRDGR